MTDNISSISAHPEKEGRFSGAGEILRIAVPSSLSMVSFTVMQFIDGFMVAKIRPLGSESLSAQFVGGFSSFIVISFFVGLLSMISTLVAQNLGAKRHDQCGRYTWTGIYISLICSAFMLLLLPVADNIFALFKHGPEVQRLETMYFRYMICFAPMNLISKCFENFFFGLHRAMTVFVVTLCANIINAIGNYMLIFGKLGLPALGLQGAAIATGIGCGVIFVSFAVIFWLGRSSRQYATRDFRSVTRRHFIDLIKIGIPNGLQFFMDMFSWGIAMMLLVGKVKTVLGEQMDDASTIHLAATTVVMRYAHVSFMPAVGLSIAIAAVVGRHIGAGRKDLARKRAWTAWLMGFGYMGLCGAVFGIFGEQLAGFFMAFNGDGTELDSGKIELVIQVAKRVFICAAVFQIFDATNIVFNGALKGAGDTLFAIIISIICGVVIGCGGGVLMLYLFPQTESVGVWIAGAANVIFMGTAYMLRFISGRWEKIDLLGSGTAGETLIIGPEQLSCHYEQE